MMVRSVKIIIQSEKLILFYVLIIFLEIFAGCGDGTEVSYKKFVVFKRDFEILRGENDLPGISLQDREPILKFTNCGMSDTK